MKLYGIFRGYQLCEGGVKREDHPVSPVEMVKGHVCFMRVC